MRSGADAAQSCPAWRGTGKILLGILLVSVANAQSILDARIARGDDPRWSSPDFDDRSWPRVRETEFRPEDAARNRLWLRMRVEIPAGGPAVLVAHRCPCEFYLNGIRIGATGGLDAPRPAAGRELRTFAVPPTIPPGLALLAVRQYHAPGLEAATSFHWLQSIRIVAAGEAGSEAQSAIAGMQVIYLLRLGFLLLAIGGILAANAGARPGAVSFGILAYLLQHTAMAIAAGWLPGLSHAGAWAVIWTFAFLVIPSLLWVQFTLAGVRIPSAWAAAYLAVHFIFRLPWTVGLYMAEPAWWTPWAVRFFLVPSWLALALASGLLVYSWRRSPRSRLLLIAAILVQVLNISGRLTAIGRIANPGFTVAGLPLNADLLANLLFVCLATGHVVRAARERRNEEQILRAEMESAQTVQTLLLSQPLPSGVEAVYLPAGSVGGDFYQAVHTPAGTLVVTGDASGKGLQAAMRVAAILGALRNRQSNAPAALLAELNRVLLGGPGFVTCCCALFPPQGPICVANAGHPAPYAAGREIDLPPGLPLGLSPDGSYEEIRVDMAGPLTFVSDGVVEAADSKGELFGFDRAAAVSTRPAAEIAEAAKAWGQNDDITVVTVRRGE